MSQRRPLQHCSLSLRHHWHEGVKVQQAQNKGNSSLRGAHEPALSSATLFLSNMIKGGTHGESSRVGDKCQSSAGSVSGDTRPLTRVMQVACASGQVVGNCAELAVVH